MLHQIIQFAIKHWPLVSGFIIIAILLFIEEARSQGASSGKLSPSAVTHLINREEGVVVDIRDANAYRDGHIVNSKNMVLADFDRHQEKLKAQQDHPIILVDASGFKTPQLLLRLKKAGFTKVFLLKGGMDSWKLAGMPVVKK